MQQMFCYGLTAMFLLLCSWQDVKTGKVRVYWIVLFGVFGLIADILFQRSWRMCIGGMLPGAATLLFGKVSNQQIGYGDGLVLTATGLLLTGKETACLIVTALFLCSLCTIGMFFANKVKRHSKLPFLPFLAAGFGIQVLFICTA